MINKYFYLFPKVASEFPMDRWLVAGHRQKYLKRSHPPSQMFALGSILALCFSRHHHHYHCRHHHRHRSRHHQQHYTDEDLQFEFFLHQQNIEQLGFYTMKLRDSA